MSVAPLKKRKQGGDQDVAAKCLADLAEAFGVEQDDDPRTMSSEIFDCLYRERRKAKSLKESLDALMSSGKDGQENAVLVPIAMLKHAATVYRVKYQESNPAAVLTKTEKRLEKYRNLHKEDQKKIEELVKSLEEKNTTAVLNSPIPKLRRERSTTPLIDPRVGELARIQTMIDDGEACVACAPAIVITVMNLLYPRGVAVTRDVQNGFANLKKSAHALHVLFLLCEFAVNNRDISKFSMPNMNTAFNGISHNFCIHLIEKFREKLSQNDKRSFCYPHNLGFLCQDVMASKKKPDAWRHHGRPDEAAVRRRLVQVKGMLPLVEGGQLDLFEEYFKKAARKKREETQSQPKAFFKEQVHNR